MGATPYGTISSDTITPNDETGLVQLPDGRLMAFMRCNHVTKRVLRTVKSLDSGITAGATWGAITDTTVPAYGKPAVCITPQGIIVGISREYLDEAFSSNRTIYFYSRANNFDSYTSGFIDNRTANFMYGKPFYSPLDSRVIVNYAVEGQNSTTHQGPNIIVRKELIISTSAVTNPNLGIDPDYQSLLDFAQAAGETLPGATLKTKQNVFVSALRAASKLTQSDGYYVVKQNDATLSAISKRNWRKAWIKAITTGTPTYGVNGWDLNAGGATTDHFNTGLQLNQQANFTLNAAELIFYTDENVTVRIGVGDGSFSTKNQFTGIAITGGNISFNINGTSTTSKTLASSNHLIEIKRLNSTTLEAFVDGVSLGTAAVSSTGRSGQNLYVAVERYISSFNNYTDMRFGLVGIGGLKNSWNDEWYAYLNSL